MTPLEQHSLVQQKNSRATKVALSLYFALGVVLASLPEALVQELPLEIVDGIFEPFLPTIASLSTISPFPNVLWLFLLVMWATLPVAAYRIGKLWTFNAKLFRLRRGDQWFLAGSTWLIAVPVAYFMYAGPRFYKAYFQGRKSHRSDTHPCDPQD